MQMQYNNAQAGHGLAALASSATPGLALAGLMAQNPTLSQAVARSPISADLTPLVGVAAMMETDPLIKKQRLAAEKAAKEAAAAQAKLEAAEGAARQSAEAAIAEAVLVAEAAKEELSSLRIEFNACRDARAAIEERAEASRREAEEHLTALRKLEADAMPAQDLQRLEDSMAELQRLTAEATKASARESVLQAELEQNQALLAQAQAALKEAREKEKTPRGDFKVLLVDVNSAALHALDHGIDH